MQKKQFNFLKFISCSLILLVCFNVYYFFIYRKVGPFFYIKKIINKPIDDICGAYIYNDLRDEYLYLNKSYENEQLIVFVGDSITKRFNTQEFFKLKNVANRGIYSDTTLGFLNRIETNINFINIDKLFIMIGYNDLKFRTNDEIIDNYIKILSKVKANKIYIQSILPVHSDRKDINERIVELNKLINKLSIDGGFFYIDLHSHFIGHDGGIKSELTRDGTHPNYFGYKLWFTLVRELL